MCGHRRIVTSVRRSRPGSLERRGDQEGAVIVRGCTATPRSRRRSNHHHHSEVVVVTAPLPVLRSIHPRPTPHHHRHRARLNYYPIPQPRELPDAGGDSGGLGISRHTDAGALTVLRQDPRVASLQVVVVREAWWHDPRPGQATQHTHTHTRLVAKWDPLLYVGVGWLG